MAIAIITGASSGIGAEFARQLDGYSLDSLWLIARRKDRLQVISKTLKTPCKILSLDLANNEAIESLRPQVEIEKPDVRFLVNCAGFGKLGLFQDLSLEHQLEMIDVNLRAVAHLSHLVLPFMVRGSCLVNVASVAGLGPLGGFAVYSAGKAFVIFLSTALIPELKPRGIHSIAVCPGPVATEFGRVLDRGSTLNKARMTNKADPGDVVARALRDAANHRALSLYGWQYRLCMPLLHLLPRKWMAALALRALYRVKS